MTVDEILVKYFGKDIIQQDKDTIINIIKSKIKDMRKEIDYLTTIITYDEARELEKDPDGSYFCSDEVECAAFVIDMTTARIKELEGVLLFLLQKPSSYEKHAG